MKAVIQRVSAASVSIDGSIKGEILKGFLVLLGVGQDDSNEDVEWLSNKIVNLRIFSDPDGLMNLNLKEVDGNLLVISQFTLHAKTKKGNRPSYIHAAKPDIAIPLYEKFVANLKELTKKDVQQGEFGADMQVSLINDGPVTIIIDTKDKK